MSFSGSGRRGSAGGGPAGAAVAGGGGDGTRRPSSAAPSGTRGDSLRVRGSGGGSLRSGAVSSGNSAGRAGSHSGDTLGSSPWTRQRPASASCRSPNVSRIFSGTPDSAGAIRDKLVPQQEIPSRFCVHCRGPHLPGGPPHPHYTVADRYKGLSIDVTEFAKHHKKDELPAAKDNGKTQAIRWKTAGAPDVGVDVAYWLPIFVDGVRETRELLRMVATQGAKAMMRLPSERVVPLVPSLVAPLRTALNTFEPSTVAAALDLLRFLLSKHRWDEWHRRIIN